MSDNAKTPEKYATYYGRINHKQIALAGCIDQLNGNEAIDGSLGEKLKQCIARTFDQRDQVMSRMTEMFPDLRVSESKL